MARPRGPHPGFGGTGAVVIRQDPKGEVEVSDEPGRLLAKLERLPPRASGLLVRWALGGVPATRLAQTLGVSEATLAIALSRAAHRLAQIAPSPPENEGALARALVADFTEGLPPSAPELRAVWDALRRLRANAEPIREQIKARAARNARKETWLRWGLVLALGLLALLWR